MVLSRFFDWWASVPSRPVRIFCVGMFLLAVLIYATIWYVATSTDPWLLP